MKTGARKKSGFSLVEVMIATGILTIGFAFIAGVFPVGIKLVASATETTMAPIVEQEAFAKIRLYGVDDSVLTAWPIDSGTGNPLTLVYGNAATTAAFNLDELDYPSAVVTDDKNYSWSAICRYVGGASGRDVEVTVFVSRKAGAGARPMPVKVGVLFNPLVPALLQIDPAANPRQILTGSTIVDDATGYVYEVVGRGATIDIIELDRDWAGGNGSVWVVPPAAGSSRNPCIGVYWHEPEGF